MNSLSQIWRSKGARGFARILQANTLNNAVSFGITLVVARGVGPAEFGRVGIAISVILVFGMFLDFGLSTSLVKRFYDDQSETFRALLIKTISRFKIAVLAGVIVFAYPLKSFVIAIFPILDGYEFLVYQSIVAAGLLSIWNTLRSIEQARQDFVAFQNYTLAYAALRLISCAVLVLYFSLDADTIIISLYLLPLTVLLCYYYVRHRPRNIEAGAPPEQGAHSWGRVLQSALKYGSWVALSGVAYVALSRIPQLFLANRSIASEVGLYSAALTFLAVFTLLNSSARTLILPNVTSLKSDEDRVRFLKTCWKLSPIYFLVLGLVLAGLVVLQVVFLGEAYRASAPVFVIMGLGIIVTMFFGILNTLVHSHGIPHLDAFTNSARLVILSLAIWLVPGTALAAAICFVVILCAGEIAMYLVISYRTH